MSLSCATLEDITGGGSIPVPASSINLVRFAAVQEFRGQPARNRFFWQFLCVNVTAQASVRDFRLTVEALNAPGGAVLDTDKVEFKVDPNLTAQQGEPTYTFPEPDYVIAGPELDAFVPFGGSDVLVTGARIGGKNANAVNWLAGTNFWWANFSGLATNPGGGDYLLTVTNMSGSASTDVTIDAPPPPNPTILPGGP